MLEYLFAVVLVYFIVTIVLHFLVFPNQLFKTQIQKTSELKKFVSRFKSGSRERTLRRIYEFVLKNYSRERHKLAIYFWHHFYWDVSKIVRRKTFLPCHVQNLVFITLAVNAGFPESEFERKFQITKFLTIHQYIIVKLGKKKVNFQLHNSQEFSGSHMKRFKVDPFFRIFKEI